MAFFQSLFSALEIKKHSNPLQNKFLGTSALSRSIILWLFRNPIVAACLLTATGRGTAIAPAVSQW